MPDNILTSAEIKRHGLAVIEERLAQGPVHLMKRNRRAAVVLSEAEYERLLQGQTKSAPGQGALQWLLTHAPQGPQGPRTRAEIDAELEAGRDW